MHAVQSWLCEVREYANANVSVLLVGNKCDLGAKRMVTQREAKKLADENNCVDYIETSAKTGDQVNDAFMTVTRFVPSTNSKIANMMLAYTISNNLIEKLVGQ